MLGTRTREDFQLPCTDKTVFIYFDSFLFPLVLFSINIAFIKYILVMSLSSPNFSKICFSSPLIQFYILLLYQKNQTQKKKNVTRNPTHTHKPTKTQNENKNKQAKEQLEQNMPKQSKMKQEAQKISRSSLCVGQECGRYTQ